MGSPLMSRELSRRAPGTSTQGGAAGTLLPAYGLVAAVQEAVVDEVLVGRAGLAGFEETADEPRGLAGSLRLRLGGAPGGPPASSRGGPPPPGRAPSLLLPPP